jgi:hypothetical protein
MLFATINTKSLLRKLLSISNEIDNMKTKKTKRINFSLQLYVSTTDNEKTTSFWHYINNYHSSFRLVIFYRYYR